MNAPVYSAFLGARRLATGSLAEAYAAAAPHLAAGELPLLFDHATGDQGDFDPRGLPTPETKPGPGRPKLGVTATEVTLLPRHWEWLARQPAKASGTLRRLVEDAMAREATDPRRRADVLARVLWSLAGDQAGFEEVARALRQGDLARAASLAAAWPGDLPAFVRDWS